MTFDGTKPVIVCDACAAHHAEHCDTPFTCRDIEALRQAAFEAGRVEGREQGLVQAAKRRLAEIESEAAAVRKEGAWSKHMGVNEGLNHFAKMQGGRTAKGIVATPSPDTEALTKLHNYLFAHRDAIDMPWCAKVIEEARQSLTATQAELRTMLLQLRRYRAHHELLMKMQDNGTGCICDLCKQTDQLLRTQGGESSDTLPPKEK